MKCFQVFRDDIGHMWVSRARNPPVLMPTEIRTLFLKWHNQVALISFL